MLQRPKMSSSVSQMFCYGILASASAIEQMQVHKCTTFRGRANTAKLTYATFALIYLYHRYGRKKPPPTQAELAALREERGACATFPGGIMDGDGDGGDTNKEEKRGSCFGGDGGDTNKEKQGSCYASGDAKKTEETEAVADDGTGKPSGAAAAASVSSDADNAKKALYGPDVKPTVSSGSTKVVTRFGTAKSPIKPDEIGKIASNNELSAAEIETSKPPETSSGAAEQNAAVNVESSLALDKIEQGTLQNASLSAEVDTAKGTLEKIGDAVLQNF